MHYSYVKIMWAIILGITLSSSSFFFEPVHAEYHDHVSESIKLGTIHDELTKMDYDYKEIKNQNEDLMELLFEMDSTKNRYPHLEYPFISIIEQNIEDLNSKESEYLKQIKKLSDQRNEIFDKIYERHGSIPTKDLAWIFSLLFDQNEDIQYVETVSGKHSVKVSIETLFHGPDENGTASLTLEIKDKSQRYSYTTEPEILDYTRGETKKITFDVPVFTGEHELVFKVDAVSDEEEHTFVTKHFVDFFVMSDVQIDTNIISDKRLEIESPFNFTNEEGVLSIHVSEVPDKKIDIKGLNKEIGTLKEYNKTIFIKTNDSRNFNTISGEIYDKNERLHFSSNFLLAYAAIINDITEEDFEVRYSTSTKICEYVNCNILEEEEEFIIPSIVWLLFSPVIVILLLFVFMRINDRSRRYDIGAEGPRAEEINPDFIIMESKVS